MQYPASIREINSIEKPRSNITPTTTGPRADAKIAIDEYNDLIAPKWSTPYSYAQSAVSPVYVTPAVSPSKNK